jgi:hypothetical protein
MLPPGATKSGYNKIKKSFQLMKKVIKGSICKYDYYEVNYLENVGCSRIWTP